MLGSLLLTIVETLGSLLSGVLLARFVMQWQRISFRNPLGQFVVATTDWLVLPLRRFIPGLGGLDLASLLPAYLLQVVLLFAVFSLRGGVAMMPPGELLVLLFWQAILSTLRISVYLLIGALFLQAILSWVNPFSPLAQPLAQLTGPFLTPIRRIVPPIAAVDLSPLIAILLAQVVLMFL